MTQDEFHKKYPILAPALDEFQYQDGRTDDDIAAIHLLNEAKNPLEYRIAAVEGLLNDCRRLLADFERDGAAFALATNRTALSAPKDAKAWLTRMTAVWDRVLGELRKLPD